MPGSIATVGTVATVTQPVVPVQGLVPSLQVSPQRTGAPKNGTPKVVNKTPLQALTRGGDATRYRGVIKSFFSATGFGFIECAEVKEKYGFDVFLHRQQCASHTVGQCVEFNIEPNRQGKPQARFLVAVGDPMEADPLSLTAKYHE